ncbi:MAG: hypothetical protein AAGF59_09855, partial [Pseudomonadota bacterium]
SRATVRMQVLRAHVNSSILELVTNWEKCTEESDMPDHGTENDLDEFCDFNMKRHEVTAKVRERYEHIMNDYAESRRNALSIPNPVGLFN